MNREDFEFLYKIRTASDEAIENIYAEFYKEAWSFRAFENHVKISPYQLNKKAIILIFYVHESIIGKMMKSLRIIDEWQKKHPSKKEISFDDVTMKIIPDLKIEKVA